MKRYRVIVSPQALRDLAGIENWIEQQASARVAKEYSGAILARCRKLEQLPRRGREREDIRRGLRTIVFRRRVTIGYIVEDGIVTITGFVGRGRDLAAALGSGRA